MARMYPDELDPGTESGAERLLYSVFRDELNNDYTVFHSVGWQALTDDGRRRDGEADFLIAHPENGILVLEVKGGGIAYDGRTRQWSSTGSSGFRKIKNPFSQAKDSKYVLRDLLAHMLDRPVKHVTLGHAVAFPDTVVGSQLLGPDMPREIIFDQTNRADVERWVTEVLRYWRGRQPKAETAPGAEIVDALMDLLGKQRLLRPAMWGDFVLEHKEMIKLTEQQYLILDMLNTRRQAAIRGCAGSGKTMIAVEKAVRLARQGFRVLLTCYNRNLVNDLQSRLDIPKKLDIINFHELCYRFADEAGVLPRNQEENEEFYANVLPNLLLEAVDRVETRYDAIVVDEGQDFRENWWFPLQTLLQQPDDGILYIFFDDNQRIYVRSGEFPIQEQPFSLTINCRNTQNIHRYVVKCYQGDELPTVRGPEGQPVDLLTYDKQTGLNQALMTLLEHLVLEEKIPTDEITVLSTVAAKSPLKTAASNKLSLTHRWPPAPGQIYWSTIQAFKGLERAVIVLADVHRWPQEWTDMEPLLYVGMSRARNYLTVLLPEDSAPELHQFFSPL